MTDKESKVDIDSDEFGPLTHVSFNHDHTCFICCSKKGFHIFKNSPFAFHATRKKQDVEIAEMIGNSNYIGYVTKENKAVLFDIKKREVLGEIHESRPVLGMKFTKSYLVLVFRDEIDIYTRVNMERKFWNIKTIENNDGLCCTSGEGDVIGVPSEKIGCVNVVDLAKQKIFEINAHNGAIRCIALDQDGKKLATASIKGTLVRVWDVENEGKMVKEFRRGRKQAEMYCINFSRDGDELCCYSSRGTVHVFSLLEGGKNRRSKLHVLGYLGFSYISSTWSKEKASVLEGNDGQCVFGKDSDTIIVVTKSGYFNTISFKENESPELKQNSIFSKITPSPPQMRKEVEQILQRFPDRTPVMLSVYKKDPNVPKLQKRKFLVPKKCQIQNFRATISKKLRLEGQTVQFYVGDNEKEVLPEEIEKTFEVMYEERQSEDGFLYLKYSIIDITN